MFELIEAIGQGSYGTVYKAREKSTGELKAIKIIQIEKEEMLQSCIKELSFLEICKSKYIVQYYSTYVLNNDFWIILEYCDGGSAKDVLKYLKSNDLTLSEETV